MFHRSSNFAAAVITAAFFSTAMPAQGQQKEPYTHDTIIAMSRAGLSDTVIVARVLNSTTALDASANSLVYLHEAGVSDAVIDALIRHSAGKRVKPRIVLQEGQRLVEVPEGTEFSIASPENIRGKRVTAGQSLTFVVHEDLKIDGEVILAKGAAVQGVVTETRKPGMMGRSGKLSIRLESVVSVDGRQLNIRSVKGGNAGDNFGTMYALSYLIGPFALLTQGKDARIKKGTVIKAFIDEPSFVIVSR